MPMTRVTGQARYTIGSLRYPSPPEPGTIVGPHPITREWLTVLGTDSDGRTWLAPSTKPEVDAVPESPRSLTEIAIQKGRPS